MSFELIHTSVLRDLDGQSGFGVAAMTNGLPRALRDALVARSDGSELDGATDRAISYAVCHVGGSAWPVLTCVTRCGADWSGRPNRVAHHLVLEAADRCPDGPIALARSFPFASDVPAVGLRSAPVLPSPCPPDGAAHGVDPAWFDLLADRLSAMEASTVTVRLPIGLDPVLLLAAVTEHLEPRRRWAVQWSTAPVFHAGPGLPSIVIAREQDPQAFDLALPAPAPRMADSGSMPGLTGAPSRPPSAVPCTQPEKPSGPPRAASRFPQQPIQPARPERALPERVASTPVTPWLPIALFAAAAVIGLVALGLLLW